MSGSAHPALRVLAAVAGLVLFAGASWGSLFVFLGGAIAAQRPDPGVEDGDPCCPHPDSWEEVASWSAYPLVGAAVVAAVFALAAASLVWADRGRRPSARRLALVPAAGVLITGSAMAAALLHH